MAKREKKIIANEFLLATFISCLYLLVDLTTAKKKKKKYIIKADMLDDESCGLATRKQPRKNNSIFVQELLSLTVVFYEEE